MAFVFVIVIYLNFQAAKQYVQEEMSNNAQNTASFLSLSLANAKGNISKMSTMINAIYDSGYFQKIILVDTKGEILYQRFKDADELDIPSWFLSLYDFNIPLANSTVSSGWNPIGSIQVIPLEDSSHLKLYKNFIEILKSFALLSLLSFSLLYFLLRLILSSLINLKEQAEAVSDNNFIINENIPATSEFKEVTLAMNKMVTKVKTIFEREASSVQNYHKLLYTDALTGLSNRNYLELKLGEFISSQEADASGSLLTIYLDGITEANKSLGHEKVNSLIQDLAKEVQESTEHNPKILTARLDGTKICIIFPKMSSEDIFELCESILTFCLVSLEKSNLDDIDTSIKLIISAYTAKDTVSNLLSNIQNALHNAQKNSITDLSLQDIVNNGLERSLIENRIKEHSIALALQDVFDKDEHILHSEAYVRLFDESKNIYEAGSFIPLVHKMNLDSKLDQNVINYALKEPDLQERNIAINISARFIQSKESITWLKERLAGIKEKKVLNFEVSNHNLLSSLNEGLAFASILRENGHKFGIDRFNIEEGTNLNYLQMIKPEYLKIDASYLQDMLTDEKGQKNNALQILIESLDIKIIATNIENEEVKETLASTGIKYFQGSFLAQPKLV